LIEIWKVLAWVHCEKSIIICQNNIISSSVYNKLVIIRKSSSITKSNQKNAPSQWAQLIGEFIDKLIGTNVSTTMRFDGLEIDVPQVKGPDGADLISAKWVINGKIQWTTSESNKG
jgi:hypothetical protein